METGRPARRRRLGGRPVRALARGLGERPGRSEQLDPSQWYAEPKRLEELGCLRSRKERGRTREGRITRCDAMLGSLATLRAELAEQRARFDEAERIAATLPHRARYLRLVHRLGRLLLDAHEQWLDEVEAELS